MASDVGSALRGRSSMKPRRQTVDQWDAGYVRVSTDMQMERDALQNQIQALEAYASAQGLALHLYKDEGISAKDTDRPDLQRLLTDVQSGRVRTVLVTKLDRISRSLADLLDLMRLFDAHGVKFVSLRDSIDTSGPVGRFMLHILGAIAELERGITAERVAEDMKLRAKRGKWNGGLAPYGRRMVDGRLDIVPEEAAILQRMRALLLERQTWRGVTVALNRAGLRTRGWEPLERDGRVVRKGHLAEECTTVSVKRVLMQPINGGTLVYNRRQASGKTHVPRPAGEHVVVEGFCAPIFSHEEMDELRRTVTQMDGQPSRTVASPHLLSGLLECACGARMYGAYDSAPAGGRRYRAGGYRCRRSSSKGTCSSRRLPNDVVETAVVGELRRLALDEDRLRGLAGEAQGAFAEELRPLRERQAAAAKELDRLRARLDTLLELAEDRLISKQEYANRRGSLEGERAALEAELAALETDLTARTASAIDIEGTLRGLRHLGDVFDELEDTRDRRRLLATCLHRVVARPGALELHLAALPLLRPDGAIGAGDDLSSSCNLGPAGGAVGGASGPEFGGKLADDVAVTRGAILVNGDRMDARAFANTQMP